MIRPAIALTIGLTCLSASAQMTPVGIWHTIDDKTNEVKSEITIAETAGVVSGKVTKLLRKRQAGSGL